MNPAMGFQFTRHRNLREPQPGRATRAKLAARARLALGVARLAWAAWLGRAAWAVCHREPKLPWQAYQAFPPQAA